MAKRRRRQTEQAEARPTGRPRYYDTPEQMEAAVDDYFAQAGYKNLTGLALYLGFRSRNGLYAYGQRKEFKDVVEYAMSRVEEAFTEYGFSGKNPHFADRMLTRHGYVCVEQSKQDTVTEHRIVLFGKPDPDGGEST